MRQAQLSLLGFKGREEQKEGCTVDLVFFSARIPETMADPAHIFSNEDALVLDADVGKNERMIRAFRSKNDNLYLGLPETFKEEQLSVLSESLLTLSAKHRLKHFWYILTLQL